jgi:hypothetical protein
MAPCPGPMAGTDDTNWLYIIGRCDQLEAEPVISPLSEVFLLGCEVELHEGGGFEP